MTTCDGVRIGGQRTLEHRHSCRVMTSRASDHAISKDMRLGYENAMDVGAIGDRTFSGLDRWLETQLKGCGKRRSF
jgi:hypothetical protein